MGWIRRKEEKDRRKEKQQRESESRTRVVKDEMVFSSVQLLSPVWLFETPWIAAHHCLPVYHQHPKFTQTHVHRVSDAIQSSHPLSPLLLLPPIPPSMRVFSKESTLRMRWPKYWSSALGSIFPKNTQDWSPLQWTGWTSLQSKGRSRVFSNTTV